MDLLKLTALELGEKIKAKEVTVREAVDAVIGNVFEEKTLIRAAYTYECATKKMHETPASVGLMSEKEVR